MHADIEWDDQGQPLSKSFGDVYFSKANGLEETRHVFLQHNQLTDRWQHLSENSFFVIGETGFGSGLNFLAAWDLWLKTAPATAQLHFVSVEKFPLHKQDLQKALALWPELEFLSAQLIEAYPCFVGKIDSKTPSQPPPSQGEEQSPPLGRGGLGWGHAFHRLSFMQGRIKLTLIIDDAAEGFTKLLASTHPLFIRTGFKVDAWFLDGFAPAKNPQMWSDDLFSVLANLSHCDTTATTFSSSEFQEKTVTIIGGGISGCHTARALAERGWQVTLIERHQDLAQEASGNPQGSLYAKLSMLDEPQAAFNLHALQFALHHYANIWPKIGQQSGSLQLAYNPAETKLHQDLTERFAHAEELVQFVTAEQASKIAGITLQYAGLYFPKSGWINSKKLCKLLTNHSKINIKYDSQAIEIKRINYRWRVQLETGAEIESDVVVLANAHDAARFELTQHLPFNRIRGQVTYLPEPENLPLKTVVSSAGYISPADNNQVCIGATFNLRDTDPNPRIEDHQTNLNNLKLYSPDIAAHWQDIEIEKLNGRVAFRCSLPDYLPAVGQAPNKELLQQHFAPLSVNARAGITQAGNYHPGLYLNLAQGSRGLTYTPLCAELLASIINQEPLPISQDLANALNPARFLIRGIVKRKNLNDS
ncbi:MAG: FAD-dependent 5-carboxymethylaminomethyl-2-thiouridine(34) oxidoreductase MnmC [Cellvibrio sp.]|nr:FAD-dependent 5-carboxymethylaminomethyl-2-thiouridine(34) oxidoreductase MnmC [Cellvibrio sp.]